MNSEMDILVSDLEQDGWHVEQHDRGIKIARDAVIIEAFQQHVTMKCGDFSRTRTANMYWHTMERFRFLLASVQEFVEDANTGKLKVMKRWNDAEKRIARTSWADALHHPTALFLLEAAVLVLDGSSGGEEL